MSKKIDFQNIVKENRSLILKTLQELLQIKSVLDENTITKEKPFGEGINQALEYMLTMAKKDGFETINDQGYAGHIAYGDGSDIVGILCHLDVVPEGKNWQYGPYDATIVDDKMYARGSTDDKGPTIACYYALKFIKDANIKLKKQIRLILGTDEETNWRGIRHYLSNYETPKIGFAPDCSFPLVYGEKGRMSYDLRAVDSSCCDIQNDLLLSLQGGERYNVVIDEASATSYQDLSRPFYQYLNENNLKGDVTLANNVYTYLIKGTAAHAMEPQKGVNAGTHLCNFFKDYSHHPLVQYVAKYHHLDYYCEKLGLTYNDPEMGPITCNIGIIDITKDHSRVTLDLRYPVRYDTEHFLQVFSDITNKMGLEIYQKTNKKPHYVAPTDDLVVLLYEAYQKHTKDTINKPFTVGGGTYASILEHAVAYGMCMPYEEDLAHQKDEYLSITTLMTSILIYIDAIIALGEIDA